MSTRDQSKHWIVASMTRGARRTAVALSALTLAVTLAFAGTLYDLERNAAEPLATRSIALAQDAPASEGVERIVDDAVPLAAGPQQSSSVSATPLVGLLLASALGFFALRIRQVDASISSMRSSVR